MLQNVLILKILLKLTSSEAKDNNDISLFRFLDFYIKLQALIHVQGCSSIHVQSLVR